MSKHPQDETLHNAAANFLLFQTTWSVERRRGRRERWRRMWKDEEEEKEKKTEGGKSSAKHNGSIHPLTSGELSPDDRAFSKRFKKHI